MACTANSAVGAIAVFLLTVLVVGCLAGEVSPRRRSGGGRGVLMFRMLYAEPCRDSRRHFLAINNFSSQSDDHGNVVMNAAFRLLKTARTVTKMKVVIHKCRDAVSSNTCEYFATWPFSSASICTMMTARGLAWSGIMRSIRPEFHCPIHAGSYRLRNGTVDLSLAEAMFTNMEVAGNVWSSETTIFDQDNLLWSCFKCAVDVKRVRNKS